MDPLALAGYVDAKVLQWCSAEAGARDLGIALLTACGGGAASGGGLDRWLRSVSGSSVNEV